MHTTYIVLPPEVIDEIKFSIARLGEKIENISDAGSKEWLSEKEFRSLLGISPKTSQNYRNRGEISFTRKGNLYFYHRDDIQEFMRAGYFKNSRNS